MFRFRDGVPSKRKVTVVAGVGGAAKGGLAVVSGATAIKATAGFSAGELLGIFVEDALADALVDVELIQDHILTATVAGITKTSLVDTDRLTVFDISDEATINLDDTTGGSFVYVGGYDSEQETADFMATEASKFI